MMTMRTKLRFMKLDGNVEKRRSAKGAKTAVLVERRRLWTIDGDIGS